VLAARVTDDVQQGQVVIGYGYGQYCPVVLFPSAPAARLSVSAALPFLKKTGVIRSISL
jgi:hypothetical protein